jgi:hypothetical protein
LIWLGKAQRTPHGAGGEGLEFADIVPGSRKTMKNASPSALRFVEF